MTRCNPSKDIQIVQVNYSNYNDMTIDCVRINIDRDKHKTLRVVDVPVINEQGEEIIEKKVQYSIYDEPMSYELEYLMSTEDVSALIKALQQLYKQAKTNQQ